MVARRCLQVTFLEGLAVPYTIPLVHIHVIHVNGYPDIGGRIRNLGIHTLVDDEIIGLGVTVLDVIDARLAHTGEVKLHVVVFVIMAPCGECSLVGFLGRSVVLDAP